MIPCRAGRRSTWIPLRACRSLSWWIALERSAATGCVRCALRSKLPSTALGERPPMPGTRRQEAVSLVMTSQAAATVEIALSSSAVVEPTAWKTASR